VASSGQLRSATDGRESLCTAGVVRKVMMRRGRKGTLSFCRCGRYGKFRSGWVRCGVSSQVWIGVLRTGPKRRGQVTQVRSGRHVNVG